MLVCATRSEEQSTWLTGVGLHPQQASQGMSILCTDSLLVYRVETIMQPGRDGYTYLNRWLHEPHENANYTRLVHTMPFQHKIAYASA